MILGIASERSAGERRVALVPTVISGLRKAGIEVVLERGAGAAAGFADAAYEEQGARLAQDRAALFAAADTVALIRPPTAGASILDDLRSGQIVIGLLDPLGAPDAVEKLAATGVTAFALDLLPRITRAQPMDALTSMATVAGYKAVLLAAAALHKMYPMMITAAGTITPARVFVVGAGVAGLQAIATSRRLGAAVQAYDVRPAVKEQVESVGGKFVDLGIEAGAAETAGGYAQALGEEFYRRQREVMARIVAESDVVITTAAVPGKKAPVLVTEEMVRKMQPGSVIVDLAAETGGNCELTRRGETIEAHGVQIQGPSNLAATIPYHASQMYARNITAFLRNLVHEGNPNLDKDDAIVTETLVTRDGKVTNPRVRELLQDPDTERKE